MSATREPLPYRHKKHDSQKPIACTRPESDVTMYVHLNCPGCTAYLMAVAVATDEVHGHDMTRDERVPLIDILRQEIDDTDPMRVLFERALAERGRA